MLRTYIEVVLRGGNNFAQGGGFGCRIPRQMALSVKQLPHIDFINHSRPAESYRGSNR